jgi:Cu(I)/Ag(I) efflux system membrane fusion protein/cobalt-zinc-cadmium efflux system membrane fusion protein
MMEKTNRTLLLGVVLGLGLALAALGVMYMRGYHVMRLAATPEAPVPGPAGPLCYVSPTNPGFIRFQPGKDEAGQELVPVFPVKPGAPKTPRTVQYWMSPMDPKYVSDKPGKDPMGHELVPFFGEVGKPAETPGVAQKERKIKYWVSPMDPGYVSDKPGKAPCGMDLVPVYEEEAGAAREGTIAVDPNILQSMGVRTAKAELRPLTHTIRATGRVTYDERRLFQVTTKISGWVERLHVKATGDPIRKGQPLLSLYSPELVSAQRELLLARKNLKDLEKSDFPELREGARRVLEAARLRLQNWDIPEAQIAELQRIGEVKRELTLNSPANGVVIKRLVTQGQMVQAGMPLLEVADLSTVWVEADVYEYELPWVKVGQQAQMTLTYLPGHPFHGRVSYIYPFLKEATRTARVRLAFPNPGLELKPDMFAQVELTAPSAEAAVVVPAEAVLDTGERQHVFVSLGKGQFEPRTVKVGLRGDDGAVQVLEGLKAGDEVVTSAQFLLDSESRFREAIALMLKAGEKREGTTQAPAPPSMPPGHKH